MNSTSDDIQWVDPPPSRVVRGGGSRQQFVAKLREHPGRWAKWPHVLKSPSAGYAFRNLSPGLEVRMTRVEGGHDLYVRYVGEADG